MGMKGSTDPPDGLLRAQVEGVRKVHLASRLSETSPSPVAHAHFQAKFPKDWTQTHHIICLPGLQNKVGKPPIKHDSCTCWCPQYGVGFNHIYTRTCSSPHSFFIGTVCVCVTLLFSVPPMLFSTPCGMSASFFTVCFSSPFLLVATN